MKFSVCQVKREEVPEMVRVNTECWKETYWRCFAPEVIEARENSENSRIERTQKDLDEHPDSIKLVAKELHGKIFAMALAGEAEIEGFEGCGEIYNLYVLNSFQYESVGKSLFIECLKRLSKKGYKNVVVKCVCDTDANGFYERMLGKYVETRVYEYANAKFEEDIYIFEKIQNLLKILDNKMFERIVKKDIGLADRKDGFPEIGSTRPDGEAHSEAVSKVVEGYKVYDELIEAGRLRPNIRELNYTSGNPINFQPFPGASEQLIKFLTSCKMHTYPYSEGDDEMRETIKGYLEQEGFVNDKPYTYSDVDEFGLSKHNMTFTNGTSQAWQFILEAIGRPGDVIIVPGPNYGLFAIKPEKANLRVVVLPMDEEDDYLVNPEKLRLLILKTNDELRKKSSLREKPKVVAFLNANPNNPTGRSMGEEHAELLKRIGEVCRENNVFVIDDLVYRDIVFDETKIAKPMATIPGMFRNTITLMGLSKSYGMPAIRAGLVVADEVIIRKIINLIFRDEDAISAIAGEALAGAFNARPERKIMYDEYFSKLRKEYVIRYNIMKAMICGINSVASAIRGEVCKDIFENIDDIPANEIDDILKKGVQGVELIQNLEPESGFFVLLNFNKLKGKSFVDTTIENEVDMLRFFYDKIKLRYILGSGCLWPNENDIIGRFTFAKSKKDLIQLCYKISWAVSLLK